MRCALVTCSPISSANHQNLSIVKEHECLCSLKAEGVEWFLA